MSNDVVITLTGKDNLTPVTKNITMNLREMGEKISSLGMRMTAAFTLPVVGLIALVKGNKEVAAALKPVADGLEKVKTNLAMAFLPIINAALPGLLKLVDGLAKAVDWFAKLDLGTQQTIITIVGVLAVAGPLVTVVGQVITVVGTLQMLLPGLAVGFGAVVAPITAVVAALTALYVLINMKEFKQLLLLIGYGLFGNVPGVGQQLVKTANDWGLLGGGATAPVVPSVGGGGGARNLGLTAPGPNANYTPSTVVNVNYSSLTTPTADQLEILGAAIIQAQRRQR
jgi:hypothetical protein